MLLTTTQRSDLEAATAHYATSVDDAGHYLYNRGITYAMGMAARLGVVKDPMPGHEDMVGRLAIPYLAVSGVVDIRFRALDGTEPKYLSLTGHAPRLYGTDSLASSGQIAAIAEGEFDSLIVRHHLGIPCVGVPGAQVWNGKKHFPRMFAGFRRVYIFGDADEAGRDLTRQIIKTVPNATNVVLPEGLDVSETFLAYGADFLKERAGL